MFQLSKNLCSFSSPSSNQRSLASSVFENLKTARKNFTKVTELTKINAVFEIQSIYYMRTVETAQDFRVLISLVINHEGKMVIKSEIRDG